MSSAPKTPPLQSALGRVKGLGSAKGGTHHWLMQRLSAIALIPVGLWFVASLLTAATTDHTLAHAWAAKPLNALLLFLLLEAMLYHSMLGLQVVIEDYVHKPCCKIGMLVTLKLGTVVLMAATALAVGKIVVGG